MTKQYENGETWSAERIKELTISKIHSRTSGATVGQNVFVPRRAIPRFAAIAATIITTIALATTALAATGVLGDFFAAVTSRTVSNGSRDAIIENDYIAQVADGTPAAQSEQGEAELTLRAYYADSREIGLDFELTGVEIPNGFDYPHIGAFKLEMTDSSGAVDTWEQKYDSETEIDSRTFPGGYFICDNKNNTSQYEPGSGQDFMVSTYFTETDAGTYNVSVIVSFKGAVNLGEKADIAIGDMSFIYVQDISLEEDTVTRFALDGSWSFSFDIDEKFDNAETISYASVNSGATQGITVKSVTVSPTVCRVEVEIDFSENSLANPANAERARQRVADGDTPSMGYDEFLAKFNFMDIGAFLLTEEGYAYFLNPSTPEERLAEKNAIEEARLKAEEEYLRTGELQPTPAAPARPSSMYGSMGSGYNPETDINGTILTCYIEFDSMYFDAPETLILQLVGYNGYDGATIEIPLRLG